MRQFIFITLISIANPLGAQEIGPSCSDLFVTGINSKEKLTQFFSRLQKAAEKKDKNTLIKTVNFPLTVNGKEQKEIKNKEELSKDFDSSSPKKY